MFPPAVARNLILRGMRDQDQRAVRDGGPLRTGIVDAPHLDVLDGVGFDVELSN